MRYLALATDYDGTLAHDGVVDAKTVDALCKLRQSGRKLLLVTGRELPDLESIFGRLDLFERVVAENGALLYNPATKEKRALAQRPPQQFVDRLKERGVTNLSVGEVIVALWRPHERETIEAIQEFGLELQIIFNKDAVMILPSGVNKMTGLTAALEELGLSRHNVVATGDAENDHAFLGCCECGVAVANAIPPLKERADLVTKGSHGDGVVEVIERLLQNDLGDLETKLDRHHVTLGTADRQLVMMSPYGRSVLICGQSGGGKSTLVAGFVEQLAEMDYQVCLIDPEGDYEDAPFFKETGSTRHAPSLEHLKQLLDRPGEQVAVNLVGVPMEDRAALFAKLLTSVQESRVGSGRPHWLIVDEAHHMLPAEWAASPGLLAGDLGNVALITVHPGHVAPSVLKAINTVMVVGAEPKKVIEEFCTATDRPIPSIPPGDVETGNALVWFLDSDRPPQCIVTPPPRGERHRHIRKYAEGQLEEGRNFFFRGPENKLKLQAHNLTTFLQMAAGVDDDTWLFHLQRGDYSKWFREGIKDTAVADQIEATERNDALSPAVSRDRIRQVIEEKYTAPA